MGTLLLGRRTRWSAAVVLTLALGVAACGGDDGEKSSSSASSSKTAEKGPIVIGAAVDQTKLMKFFDGPALAAAQIRAAEVNAAGGVNGRKLQFMVQNTRLDPGRTRSAALDLASKGASLMWVTCDVDWATPSTQVGISKGLLTVAPCIGTDQMGPKRFGEKGKLAYSFGNVAQDEGAAMAALAKQKGFKTATVVADKSIAYTQNVCDAFTNRFEENGGKVNKRETWTEGDGTIGSVVSRVNQDKGAAIVICATTQKDLPAFVSGVRSAGNQTPILGPWSIDGAFWLPKDPKIANNIWLTTYASIYGDDPDPRVRRLIAKLTKAGQPPATGGFVTGAAAVDGIVDALKANGGSTDGAKLADTFEGFKDVGTVSGPISFSDQFHTVFGRTYRVIQVKNGKPRYVEQIQAGSPAKL
jgi:branched-chain amino acid transport system substrate-binding protein